jgi:hypothetical protein
MSCPYVIRETIDADHVREHGYYQLDEVVYDLTHAFAGADVEVITRPVYSITMESGERLSNVDDETVFKMLSAGLPVLHIENSRDGYIMYSRPECKPAIVATPDERAFWTYPHPIVTNASIDEVGFKAPFILEAKVHNEETDQYEFLYYELDATGFKNATKDIKTMVANKWSNWTVTKRILKARFFSNKNGQFYLERLFNFAF